MSRIINVQGKQVTLSEGTLCNGCVFDEDVAGCLSAPDCGATGIYVLADEDDFPLGEACDLSGEGTCESCQ